MLSTTGTCGVAREGEMEGVNLAVKVRCVNCDIQRRVGGSRSYSVFGTVLIKRVFVLRSDE